MELYEAMKTQRAVRKLRADPIPDDVLRRVLEAASWAPTGGNRQPWRIVVIRDDTKKRELKKLYAKRWHDYRVLLSKLRLDTPDLIEAAERSRKRSKSNGRAVPLPENQNARPS